MVQRNIFFVILTKLKTLTVMSWGSSTTIFWNHSSSDLELIYTIEGRFYTDNSDC